MTENLTISDLRKQFNKSPLLSCKYKIVINIPTEFGDVELSRKLAVLSKSFTIPKREVQTKRIIYRGRPINIRSQLEFGDSVVITVYEDPDMNVRKKLEKWLNSIDNINNTNTNKNYKDATIIAYQLDNEGKEIYGIKFNTVFLTSLGDISYSAESGSALSYDITFSYSTFETVTTEVTNENK